MIDAEVREQVLTLVRVHNVKSVDLISMHTGLTAAEINEILNEKGIMNIEDPPKTMNSTTALIQQQGGSVVTQAQVADLMTKSERVRKLNQYQKTIDTLIEVARFEYEADPTDKKATAINGFLSTGQSILRDLEGYERIDYLIERLNHEILISLFLKETADLIMYVKTKIVTDASKYMNIRDLEVFQKDVNTMLEQEVTDVLTQKYNKAKERVEDIFGVTIETEEED